jgi:hypothetical protein
MCMVLNIFLCRKSCQQSAPDLAGYSDWFAESTIRSAQNDKSSIQWHVRSAYVNVEYELNLHYAEKSSSPGCR